MSKTSETGKRGEDIACEYLKKRGYKILERNVREKWGELDIVVRAKDKTLVFVEVKTMRPFAPGGLQPEDQMTYAKRRKFERTASLYAGSYKNKNLIYDKKGWRLDVVAIVLVGEGRGSHDIRHYENI
ncbi:MAG: YraN family protein [bacterium]|nr:YraN family protein [bacterium]